MIFTLIALIIIVLGCLNFKKGFLLMLVYKIVLVQNINIIAIPGVPLLTVDLFLQLSYIILFLYKRKYRKGIVRFPYKIPYCILCFSWMMSALFAIVGFSSAITQCIGGYICPAILTYMMWCTINDEQDIKWLFECFTYVFLFAALYSFYEYYTQTNPIKAYEMSLMTDESRLIDFDYSEDDRGWRAQSIFEHAIGSGINFSLYTIFALSILLKYKIRFNKKFRYLFIITAILCIPASILSNSRSPFIFLSISFLGLINFKNKKFWYFTLIGCILLLIGWPFLSSFADNFTSLFDSEAQARVGGSSLEMRLNQLDVSWKLMTRSPVFGLGLKFRNVFSTRITAGLLGMESIWFQVLTQFGLVGLIAYITMIYYSMIVIPRKYKSKTIFYLSLAFWVTQSVTSIPGTLTYMYYMLLIIYIKQSNVYKLEYKRKYNSIADKKIKRGKRLSYMRSNANV